MDRRSSEIFASNCLSVWKAVSFCLQPWVLQFSGIKKYCRIVKWEGFLSIFTCFIKIPVDNYRNAWNISGQSALFIKFPALNLASISQERQNCSAWGYKTKVNQVSQWFWMLIAQRFIPKSYVNTFKLSWLSWLVELSLWFENHEAILPSWLSLGFQRMMSSAK